MQNRFAISAICISDSPRTLERRSINPLVIDSTQSFSYLVSIFFCDMEMVLVADPIKARRPWNNDEITRTGLFEMDTSAFEVDDWFSYGRVQ